MAPELDLSITSLSHDGRGIGFLKTRPEERGQAVFVSGALPGQRVFCQVTTAKKSFLEANLTSVISEDESLLEPFCSQFHVCGGCPLQRLPYQTQLYWKDQIARAAFMRLGGFSEADLAQNWAFPLASPLLKGFRNKIELAFGEDAAGSLVLGFRKRASHKVFNLRNCPLIEQSGWAHIANLKELAQKSGLPSRFWRFLVARRIASLSDSAQRWHFSLITYPGDKSQKRAVENIGRRLVEGGIASFSHEERKDNAKIARGEKRVTTLGEAGDLAMYLGGKAFSIERDSFFQVNNQASEILLELVRQANSRAVSGPLLDLFCGVGAPGLLLGRDAGLGLEIDSGAIRQAKINASKFSGWTYQAGDAAKKLADLAKNNSYWPVILADPPRSGIGVANLVQIKKIAPENIIYVSCNPATMARDGKELASQYELISMASVDMFPHTPHLECVGLWQKRA